MKIMKIYSLDTNSQQKYKFKYKTDKNNTNKFQNEIITNDSPKKPTFKSLSTREKMRAGCCITFLLAGCLSTLIGISTIIFYSGKKLLNLYEQTQDKNCCQQHSHTNNTNDKPNDTKETKPQDFHQQNVNGDIVSKNIDLTTDNKLENINENQTQLQADKQVQNDKEKNTENEKDSFSLWNMLWILPLGILTIILASESGKSLPRSLE